MARSASSHGGTCFGLWTQVRWLAPPRLVWAVFRVFFYTCFKWAGQIWPSCQNFSNYLSTSSFETQLVLHKVDFVVAWQPAVWSFVAITQDLSCFVKNPPKSKQVQRAFAGVTKVSALSSHLGSCIMHNQRWVAGSYSLEAGNGLICHIQRHRDTGMSQSAPRKHKSIKPLLIWKSRQIRE